MPDAQPTADSPLPKRTRQRRIPVLTESIVSALLDAKIPQRSIEKATGVNRTTIRKIHHQDLASNEQAERIKKSLRNRFALIADRTLNRITDEKLDEASAKDLMYMAAKATEIAEPSAPSVLETYSKTLQTFLTPDGTPQVVGTETVTKTVVSPTTNES